MATYDKTLTVAQYRALLAGLPRIFGEVTGVTITPTTAPSAEPDGRGSE